MLLALVALLLIPPRPHRSPGDPPIRLTISDDVLMRGDNARVRVKAAADGYLLLLRIDTQGRIRVLFPIEPTEDAALRGGREVEVRGRGDRAAFRVDDAVGSGKILAAWSSRPFHFEKFSRNGHWDYSALAAQDSVGDKEALLIALVDRMTAHTESTEPAFEYDIVTYTVAAQRTYHHSGWVWGDGPFGPGWYPPRNSPWYYHPNAAGAAW